MVIIIIMVIMVICNVFAASSNKRFLVRVGFDHMTICARVQHTNP